MNIQKVIMCPDCGKSEHVAKVSAVYISGVELKLRRAKKLSEQDVEALEDAPTFAKEASKEELIQLSTRLSPPSSGKRSTFRPIHPDWAVAALSMLAPIFIINMIASQSNVILPALIVLAGFYGFYFWKRAGLIENYQTMLQSQKTEEQRVRGAIERWLMLYYCFNDDCVFMPSDQAGTPADQIAGRIFRG